MALTRTIEIDGRPVTFRASAAVPRLYRIQYGRDIMRDLSRLAKSVDGEDPAQSGLDHFSLEVFEDIAHCMARHADPAVPDTPEAWLEQFSFFSIYKVLPAILELWGLNVKQEAESKKNAVPRSGS